MYSILYKKFIILYLCMFAIQAFLGKELPLYFPHCNRNDPKINDCLLKATEQLRPYLIKGVPEINFPVIEPFRLPQVSLAQGTSALNFKALLKDLKLDGLSNYKFSHFDFDVSSLQFFCKATLGTLKLSGNYEVTGRVLIAPLVGKGTFQAKIDNCSLTGYQKVIVVKKKGLDFIKPIVANSSIEASSPQVVLEGLFEGSELLNNVTNSIINDNINILFQDLKPVIDRIINSVITDVLLKSIEDNIPYDKLFPNEYK